MSSGKKVKVRRRKSREIPRTERKPQALKLTCRQSAAPSFERAQDSAEELSLAFERDARRYDGLWEVTL